jgi:tetratricopeptide (TPR) repeat protein
MSRWFGLPVFAIALALTVTAQDAPSGPPRSDSEDAPATRSGRQNAPPRSNGESSSRDTKIDLSPPPGESGSAPGAEPEGIDVREMRPWDPHKADKNVEVGDYYLTQKNYRAAISRYREALYWQDNHAIAQFRLGQSLEAVGQFAEARKYYEGYLKILPSGSFAQEARKALERLKDKADEPKKLAGPVL